MATVRSSFSVVALASFTAIAGCNGGSSIVPPAVTVLSQVRHPLQDANASSGYGVVRFRIWVPGRRPSRAPHRVFPKYVSTSTSKVVVLVHAATKTKPQKPQTFACTAVCTGSIVAPLGVDLFVMRLEDSSNKVLSTGTSTIAVFKKKNNVLNFTLDGVPVSVDLTPVPGTIAVVPAGIGYVLFNARDADGNIISPDGGYADALGRPLAFDIASNNASFHLGVTTISGPGVPIPFAYDGTQLVGTVTLTPSAHPGVSTSVVFHSQAVTLVPGIANRINPPIPVQLMSVTQVPMPVTGLGCGGGSCFDPNSILLLGNDGAQSATLKFDVSDGAYGNAHVQDTDGPYMNPPVVLPNGFGGYIQDGNNTFTPLGELRDIVVGGGGSPNPCSSMGTPIGFTFANDYCAYGNLLGNGYVYDQGHSVTVAYGQDRKIQEINGTDYFETVVNATPGPTQQVYAYGSLTPVSGAISVGTDVPGGTSAYFGDSDGTVKVGVTTVATFSHAIENVVATSSSIFVYENGGFFGVSGSSGTFESAPLPIGSVVEVVTGVNRVPMLVEQDGILDVMAI
jgi:hypothetical protein